MTTSVAATPGSAPTADAERPLVEVRDLVKHFPIRGGFLNHEAQRLAAAHLERHARHGLDDVDLPVQQAAADREVLDQVAHLDQAPVRTGRRRGPMCRGHVGGHEAPASPAPAVAASGSIAASTASIVSLVSCAPSAGSGFMAPVPSWYSQQRTSCPGP